ncbi:hypothetical protein PPERSA_00110 [Pseudocohnilembus persalinus]|uniref:COMM domain-containing protein n=1 Tax=Pseudocohnilembus persalinus TaxID=266149 RepID=A0A0V0Q8K8_PSEPJ|nr:hypothetical protein PPERSA_00110 [Pseudocohnilembus persalinus]|eukprot:KRW98513.1 hypothetical protein PPERSA_00110 [Pseudocohnilembus persalinus]
MRNAIQNFNDINGDQALVIQEKIFLQPGKQATEIFKSVELQKMFKKYDFLNEQKLQNIINAFSYILMQAVAEKNFPQILQNLQENGLSETHAQIFLDNWNKYGNSYSNLLKEKPVAIGDQLIDFDWAVQVPMDNSKLPVKNVVNLKQGEEKILDNDLLFSNDVRNPNLIMNFNLNSNNLISHNQQQQSQNETFSVRFTKSQVQDLFENLEDIQNQIDRLQK